MGLIYLPMGHPIVNHPVFSLIPLNSLTCTIAFLARVRRTPWLCVVNPGKFMWNSLIGKKHQLNMWSNYHMILMGDPFLMFRLIRKNTFNPWGMVHLGQTWGVGEVDSKVIGLCSKAKYHFNALILTVVTLFSTTGLIEDSSYLRAFTRDAAICVKGKSAMQGKYLSCQKKKQAIHVVTIKHFGTHLCCPIKPKGKRDTKEIIASNPNKASKAKRDIIYTMICEGANFEDIEEKTSQLLDR